MKRMLGSIAARVMPRTYHNLKVLSTVDLQNDSMLERMISYETEVRELRSELNEVRRDNRRVVELYDLVFARLQEDMPLRAKPLPADDSAASHGIAASDH
ncbi:hypothetical protein [Agromyces sp. Marseille-Q5079]|uniref:hypothetical protein n=1 Tax=Agromyces sp. Marseille-Q5079 TaxID=3439059 RepID=UPI003D9C8B73